MEAGEDARAVAVGDLEVAPPMARGDEGARDPIGGLLVLADREGEQRLAEHLVGAPPVKALGGRVPVGEEALLVGGGDGGVDRVEQARADRQLPLGGVDLALPLGPVLDRAAVADHLTVLPKGFDVSLRPPQFLAPPEPIPIGDRSRTIASGGRLERLAEGGDVLLEDVGQELLEGRGGTVGWEPEYLEDLGRPPEAIASKVTLEDADLRHPLDQRETPLVGGTRPGRRRGTPGGAKVGLGPAGVGAGRGGFPQTWMQRPRSLTRYRPSRSCGAQAGPRCR